MTANREPNEKPNASPEGVDVRTLPAAHGALPVSEAVTVTEAVCERGPEPVVVFGSSQRDERGEVCEPMC